jgi:hypothetical protein
MYEHIVSTLVVGNKAVAFFCVEPLNCTLIQCPVPPLEICRTRKKRGLPVAPLAEWAEL